MEEKLAISLTAKGVESSSSRIWKEIQYLFDYNSNIKKLKEKVKDLEDKEDVIKQGVGAAERNVESIGRDVLGWLEKVDNIKKKANEIEEQTKNAQWGCLYCKCPKLHSRYQLSKQAFRKTTELIELLGTSHFERIGHPTPPGQMPFTSPQQFNGLESRMKFMNVVMEALKDDSITTIALCGMAGVGKTTIVKEIADKVKAVNLFDEVALAVVSKDPTVANIQDQLAENLGLRIEEKTDRQRAERLYTRLMDKDKKFLVIMDDLWQEVDLYNIGIPGEREALKVVLTSRFKGVCSDMNATTFDVEVLSNKESWHLFKEAAKISEGTNDIKDIAKEVAKECGGLPLAIMVVGKALKNKEDCVWRDALQQLKNASATNIRGLDKKVYSSIKLSFEYLENDYSKKLLLLCSLFPEDYNIHIEDLVRYGKGLLWFRNVETLAQARDKVHSILDELKSNHLLLAGAFNESVKLHDVVRDFCLSIGFRDEQMHMVSHSMLKEWPQEDSYSSYIAISMTFGEIDKLPSDLECPNLKLLLLIFQGHKLHIPEGFFQGMKELRVLALSGFNGELASLLQSLVNLQTLCLHNCELYGHMSLIGSLKKLEILSFYDSYLEHFPHEIVQLSKLKSLDLRFIKDPPRIPSGVLMMLKTLEELYLDSYFQEWTSEGNEAYSTIIKEVGSLVNLQSIQLIAFDDNCLEQVLENMHLEKLVRFKITRTASDGRVREFQFRKALNFQDVNVNLLLKPAIQTLLWKAENLSLTAKGLTNLVSELDGKGFVNLKNLNLEDCDLKYLVDATIVLRSGGTFINLEELAIGFANELEELCHGNLPLGSFAKLRKLELFKLPKLRNLWGSIQQPCLGSLRILSISNCDLIRSLFQKSAMKGLCQLQQICIWWCRILETVVSNEKEDEEDIGDVEFPKLEFLLLIDLTSFRSFGPKSSLRTLFRKVMLANLETLHIGSINGIRSIVDDQMPIGSLSRLLTLDLRYCVDLLHVAKLGSNKLLQSLERLDVCDCPSLEVVFDFTGLIVDGENLECPLGRLESLQLMFLPNLKYIWRMLPEGIHAFTNLRSLDVIDCHSLRYLLSPSMARMLKGLETLMLVSCQQMEAIIGSSEREISEIVSEEDIVEKKDGEERVNKIEFPKLRRLVVSELQNFRMFCSENVDLTLPLLTEVEIENCPKMTKFCVGRLSATRLNMVNTEVSSWRSDTGSTGKKVPLDEFSSWLKDCESRIRCLDCSQSKEEQCDHLN